MKTKQLFAVSGSMPLKRVLVEELKKEGISVYSIAYQNLLKPYTFGSENQVISIHEDYIPDSCIIYTLPQDYEKAKQAFIDFYKEEPEFIEGRWYKFTGKEHIVVRFKGGVLGIGIAASGIWSTAIHIHKASNWQLMTREEIEKALSEYAVKQGYKPGVKVKEQLISIGGLAIGAIGVFYYNMHDDTLWYKGVCIYKGGKWAEIDTSEEAKPESFATLHKVEVPDKQLILDKLKELQELIEKM